MPGYNFTAQSASPKHESLARMGEAFMLDFSQNFATKSNAVGNPTTKKVILTITYKRTA